MLLCWSAVHSIASRTAVTYLWWREEPWYAGQLCTPFISILPVMEGGRSQLCCYAGQLGTPLSASYLWWREEPAVLVCWSTVHSIVSIIPVMEGG